MFKSIHNILNEHKENSDQDNSSEVGDNVICIGRKKKIRIIGSESEDFSDSDVTEEEDSSEWEEST